MQIGKKGRGKHWTAKELAARQAAADRMRRKNPKKLIPPAWLSPAALLVWNKKIAEAEPVELLDILDEEGLAVWCDATTQYERLARLKRKSVETHKAMQSWARIIATYADRYGFTPASRARLIKKRADDHKDPFGEEFD
jgi:phage terminase small subunit